MSNAQKMDVDGLMKNEDFSPQLLKIYYEKFFPFLQMFRWLSYRNDPKSSSPGTQKDFFQRREFTFVLQGDIFCRYQCFKDMEEYRAKVLERQPIRMEIGAVFSHAPSKHHVLPKDVYKPLERELVFDIDMDDYDDIRTCCTGSKLCLKCWTFMKVAIQVLKRTLEEDFGFQHILFVYSGRRGVHCWVCDSEARKLSNEQRSAVAEYLTMVSSGANKCRADLKMNGCEELHPSVDEAYKICKKWFEDPNGILANQDILKNGNHLTNILEPFSADEKDKIKKFMQENSDATSLQIWKKLQDLVRLREVNEATFKQRMENKVLLKDVAIQYTYPRLDVNVSKQMNHLLKSPFVVHPKTGRVCVPIDPENVNDFDPAKVPTIGQLVEEMHDANAQHTSLKPYLHYFETKFLQELEKTATEELRQRSGVSPGVLMDF
ncbi:unnamed protein product [Durusdinium trenchii]|uniref:DNA primase n=1 Tax=Durusdinium trenchii TaxID=1381693 RepID=A0ABP0QC57_9DINO